MINFITILLVITTSVFRPNIVKDIPLIHFQIDFIGNYSGTPTLKVNSQNISSSVASGAWQAYVNYTDQLGVYNFESEKWYTIRAVQTIPTLYQNNSKTLCVLFKSNYKETDHPTIEFNTTTLKFNIVSPGQNCILRLGFPCNPVKSTSTVKPKLD